MAAQGDDSYSRELNQDLSFFMNVSVGTLGQATSTPKSTPKRRGKRPTGMINSPFKKPAPVVTTYKAVCKICGKGYKTLRFYKHHMEGHALKAIASKLPESHEGQVIAMAPQVAMKTIEEMDGKPMIGLHASGYSLLLGHIKALKDSDEWKSFVSAIGDCFSSVMTKDKFCMPSALMSSSLSIADSLLTSVIERESLLSCFGSIADECTVSVLNSFICEFVLTFADQLVIYIFKFLRNATSSNSGEFVPAPVSSFTTEERQAIFYIGGSIIRGFKRLGYTYPTSKKWKGIIELIQCKILEEKSVDMMTEQEKLDRHWVEKSSRGGLIFLKGGMQEFLMSCACIIAPYEQVDGSLPIDSIISTAASGKPKFDWDAVVGTALDQDLSFSLMVGVLRSFINTYGKGIILRRMNKINNNKATASVTLRHKVAPKT